MSASRVALDSSVAMDYDNVVFTVLLALWFSLGDLCHSSFLSCCALFQGSKKEGKRSRAQSLSETGIGNESLWNGHTSERNCVGQSSRSFAAVLSNTGSGPKIHKSICIRATNVEMMVIFTSAAAAPSGIERTAIKFTYNAFRTGGLIQSTMRGHNLANV